MRRTLRLLMFCLLLCGTAHAEVKPFESGSLQAIRTAHNGRPFILAFWSIDCAHCPKELKLLGELRKRQPKLDIVLVSTDHDSPVAPLAEYAARLGLDSVEQWVFADPQAEKLRYEIDRRWWGELPRTYFFDADHRMEGLSGIVPPERLQRWAAEHRQ